MSLPLLHVPSLGKQRAHRSVPLQRLLYCRLFTLTQLLLGNGSTRHNIYEVASQSDSDVGSYVISRQQILRRISKSCLTGCKTPCGSNRARRFGGTYGFAPPAIPLPPIRPRGVMHYWLSTGRTRTEYSKTCLKRKSVLNGNIFRSLDWLYYYSIPWLNGNLASAEKILVPWDSV
jgi:hypothetical protein